MLIVENGTNVPDADSYVSALDAIDIAEKLGLTFPVTANEADAPLRMAAMFLEKYRNNYQGSKYYGDQSLQWPRDPVYIDDFYNEPDNIPKDLIYAQVAIASVQYTGGNLYGTARGNTISRSVGDVSVTNGNNGSLTNAAYLGLANEFLKPLFKNPKNGLLEFTVCRA